MNLKLIEEPRGVLSIVKHPEPGRHYALGADAAEGVKGGDPSAIVLVEMETCEEVAWLHGILNPRELAQRIVWLGTYYNNAFAVIESNTYGNAVVHDVIAFGYPNVYRDINYSSIRHVATERPGFRTDRQSRPRLWNHGRWFVQQGRAVIHSRVQLKEMLAIRYSDDHRADPVPEHPKGGHDDLTMAWLLAVWGRQIAYERRILPEPEKAPLTFEQRHALRVKQRFEEPDEDESLDAF